MTDTLKEDSCPIRNFLVSSVIDDLENKVYLRSDSDGPFGRHIRSKIEEFSDWFNSTCRINLLKCEADEADVCQYLLLKLKRNIKYALTEINKSVGNRKQTYGCNVCEEKTEMDPRRDFWRCLQDHEHFEELYNLSLEETTADTTNSTFNGSDESAASQNLPVDKTFCCRNSSDTSPVISETTLNDFKFNFVITYDKRIESLLYPDFVLTIAKKADKIAEYTVQRSAIDKAVCLLCRCPLTTKSRVYKLSPLIIKNHVSGQRHCKFASDYANVTALKEYHEFWRGQEPNFQAHQVHFFPKTASINLCRCHLCKELLAYDDIIDHIKADVHKNKVIKLLTAPEDKQNVYYLLDMQVDVYQIASDDLKSTPKKKNGRRADVDASYGQKCVIVRSVLTSDDDDDERLTLPGRFEEHLRFLTRDRNEVSCKACNVTFADDAAAVKRHIQNIQHKHMSGIPVHRYSFFCEICNAHFKEEASWDGHFLRGPNKHTETSHTRKNDVDEYECKTCLLVIYGDEFSLSRHVLSGGLRGAKKKDIRLPFLIKRLFRSNAFLEEEAKRLMLEANRVLECQDKVRECCDDLQAALAKIYPDCKAYAFGSRVSGLGNNQSDLDIFMDIGDMYTGASHQDSQSQEQFVKKATNLLKIYKDDFYSVIPIPSARTPIVKLHHCYTDLECDVSFRHGLGVENTKFLRFCIDVQPITQPFVLVLKKWSHYCKLNEHITNYALALMAIFYLQVNGHLLPVKTVRGYNPEPSVVIDGWETINYTVPVAEMKDFVKPLGSDLKRLLVDFFSYFSKFNYANDVVCPLLGETVPKFLFCEQPNGKKLPVEMKSYVDRIQQEDGELFRALSPFCVQDPFDLSHNLTKACQYRTIAKFKTLCLLTCEFLNSID